VPVNETTVSNTGMQTEAVRACLHCNRV
jgi:hypothetical protein